MEDKQELVAAKYLKSHLEPRKVGVKPELLYKPVAEVDYKEKGEANFNIGKLRVDFSYGPVDRLPIVLYGELNLAGITEKTLRLINKLTIQDKNGRTLDLIDIMPPGSKVYIDPFYDSAAYKSPVLTDNAFVDPKTKRVVLLGDISVPRTILSLLHEAGHLNRLPESMEEAGSKREKALSTETISPSDAAFVLRMERDAWAFALRKLRPFLNKDPNSPLNKDAVLYEIHNFALKSYSNRLKEHLPDWVFKFEEERLTATLEKAVNGDLERILVEQDFGLKQEEGKQTVKDTLTLLDKVDASLFISKPAYGLFAREEMKKPTRCLKRSIDIWTRRGKLLINMNI